MEPPKCPFCKKAEWRHVCGGLSGNRVLGHAEVKRKEPVLHPKEGFDRVAYQREYMRAYRAMKAGRAEPWPRG